MEKVAEAQIMADLATAALSWRRPTRTCAKNKTCTSRSMEEGFDGVVRGTRVLNARVTCRAGHGGRAASTAQPETCRPEKTEEREAHLAGGRAALDCATVTLRYAHAKNSHSHMHMHELTRALRCSGPVHIHMYIHVRFDKYRDKGTFHADMIPHSTGYRAHALIHVGGSVLV